MSDEEYRPVSIRPSPELRQRIRALADREQRSISRQTIWLLEYALGMLERTPATRRPADLDSASLDLQEHPGAPVNLPVGER